MGTARTDKSMQWNGRCFITGRAIRPVPRNQAALSFRERNGGARYLSAVASCGGWILNALSRNHGVGSSLATDDRPQAGFLHHSPKGVCFSEDDHDSIE